MLSRGTLVSGWHSWYWLSMLYLGSGNVCDLSGCTPSFYFITLFPFRYGTFGPKISFSSLTYLGGMGLFFSWYFCAIPSSYSPPRWTTAYWSALTCSDLWISCLEHLVTISWLASPLTQSLVHSCHPQNWPYVLCFILELFEQSKGHCWVKEWTWVLVIKNPSCLLML